MLVCVNTRVHVHLHTCLSTLAHVLVYTYVREGTCPALFVHAYLCTSVNALGTCAHARTHRAHVHAYMVVHVCARACVLRACVRACV